MQKIKINTTIKSEILPNNIEEVSSSDSLKYKGAFAYNSGNILINDYFKKNIKYEEVNNIEDADFDTMNKSYPKLLENYIDFLNKNGVEHILN